MIDTSSYLTTDGAPLSERAMDSISDIPRCRSLLIVPPFLKHFGGPLAGPAYLKGAGERAGHQVQVLDLNNSWIAERIVSPHRSGDIKGDHDKPSAQLGVLHAEWQKLLAACWPTEISPNEFERRIVALYSSTEEVDGCALNLAASSFGSWVQAKLRAMLRPDVVGLSVMFSGQVIAALAITRLVKLVWPAVKVVWGGAHVTALAERIGQDISYGVWVDGFVAGYAERTWVDLLDAVAGGKPWPAEVFGAGMKQVRAKEDSTTVPSFDLADYRNGSLTIPVQASRGCAYAKCAFCTYPKIEGSFRKMSLSALEPVIRLAEKHDAVLSFKDSLLIPTQLKDVAALIKGRVTWSACTKLHASLDTATLRRMHSEGLRTLEIGLETLDEGSQDLINKQQSLGLFRDFLDASAAAGVAVVINYMTGLPGADPGEEQRWLEVVRAEVSARPSLQAVVEHNVFQLEMLSPMGRDPRRYGIEVVSQWPWSSLMEFRLETAGFALAS